MLEIRSASAADAADIARIYAPYVTKAPASFELDPPAAEDMAARIETSLAKHAWLVASENGVIVGYAYGTTARTRAAYRFTVEVSVYLDGDARGRGIGKALMIELLETLATRGYLTAIAGVTLPNDASVRLFESLGFESVGVYRNIGYKFGRWHDVGWWQRSLVSAYPDAPPEVPLDA
ncbi:MAG: arsinothricin resistance N-acetyltransferase ArsN1 family B [Actinomycetota bacterium]